METEYQPCVLEQADAGTAIIKYGVLKNLGNARSYLRRIEKTIGFMEGIFSWIQLSFCYVKSFLWNIYSSFMPIFFNNIQVLYR